MADNTPNSASDLDRAQQMFSVLCPNSDMMQYLVIEGIPKSKARPRFRRDGRVFASPEQVSNEEALAWEFKTKFSEPLEGNIAVGCLFFRPDRHRVDVDNMLKHVMDSANEVVWHDDSQVTAQLGIVEMDQERPRTVIVIGTHSTTMVRTGIYQKTRTCPNCGKEFTSKQHNPTYCSRKCASQGRASTLATEVPCAYCGTPFRRKTKGMRFCSNPCRMSSLNSSRRELPVASCVVCGKQLSKPGYKHCRECWKGGAR